MNPDKRLARPAPPQDGPRAREADGGPGGASAVARHWPPCQRVFALHPAHHPLDGPAPSPSGPFSRPQKLSQRSRFCGMKFVHEFVTSYHEGTNGVLTVARRRSMRGTLTRVDRFSQSKALQLYEVLFFIARKNGARRAPTRAYAPLR